MVAESQVKAEVCLEVVEAEVGEEGGEGDGEDAGAAPHHGSPGFGAILSLDAYILKVDKLAESVFWPPKNDGKSA